jgi:hypothetical protein
MALIIVKTAFNALVLFLNFELIRERARMVMLSIRFIAATPVKTMHGLINALAVHLGERMRIRIMRLALTAVGQSCQGTRTMKFTDMVCDWCSFWNGIERVSRFVLCFCKHDHRSQNQRK